MIGSFFGLKDCFDRDVSKKGDDSISARFNFDLKDTLLVGRYGDSGQGNCQRSTHTGSFNQGLMGFLEDANELTITFHDDHGVVKGFSFVHGVYLKNGQYVLVPEKVYTNYGNLTGLMIESRNELVRQIANELGVGILDQEDHSSAEAHELVIPASDISKYYDCLSTSVGPKATEATVEGSLIQAEQINDKAATLKATYNLAEKLNFSKGRRAVQTILAPIVETFGVFAKLILPRMFKHIAWNDKDLWAVTARSPLLTMIASVIAFSFANPFTIFAAALVALVSSFFFGLSHEKNKGLNTVAGVVFSAPIVLAALLTNPFIAFSLMLLSPVAIHFAWNRFFGEDEDSLVENDPLQSQGRRVFVKAAAVGALAVIARPVEKTLAAVGVPTTLDDSVDPIFVSEVINPIGADGQLSMQWFNSRFSATTDSAQFERWRTSMGVTMGINYSNYVSYQNNSNFRNAMYNAINRMIQIDIDNRGQGINQFEMNNMQRDPNSNMSVIEETLRAIDKIAILDLSDLAQGVAITDLHAGQKSGVIGMRARDLAAIVNDDNALVSMLLSLVGHEGWHIRDYKVGLNKKNNNQEERVAEEFRAYSAGNYWDNKVIAVEGETLVTRYQAKAMKRMTSHIKDLLGNGFFARYVTVSLDYQSQYDAASQLLDFFGGTNGDLLDDAEIIFADKAYFLREGMRMDCSFIKYKRGNIVYGGVVANGTWLDVAQHLEDAEGLFYLDNDNRVAPFNVEDLVLNKISKVPIAALHLLLGGHTLPFFTSDSEIDMHEVAQSRFLNYSNANSLKDGLLRIASTKRPAVKVYVTKELCQKLATNRFLINRLNNFNGRPNIELVYEDVSVLDGALKGQQSVSYSDAKKEANQANESLFVLTHEGDTTHRGVTTFVFDLDDEDEQLNHHVLLEAVMIELVEYAQGIPTSFDFFTEVEPGIWQLDNAKILAEKLCQK